MAVLCRRFLRAQDVSIADDSFFQGIEHHLGPWPGMPDWPRIVEGARCQGFGGGRNDDSGPGVTWAG